MAIDRWLFDHYLDTRPCLRFYTWEPAAISLGYHQRHYPDHWNTLVWQGYPLDIVHRATGGRAVLHQGDLTYSLVTRGHWRSRRLAYESLCQFLIQGWSQLGISLSLGQSASSEPRGQSVPSTPSAPRSLKANCFATATAADLVTQNGYKLIGSAQVWRSQRVLHHGSMRLCPDPDLWQQVFGDCLPESRLVLPAIGSLITILKEAAADTWAIALEEEPITPQEWRTIYRYL